MQYSLIPPERQAVSVPLPRRAATFLWFGLIGSATILIGGCCSFRLSMEPPLRDHFETYVILGVGKRPRCPIPPSQTLLYNLRRGQKAPIWLRVVYQDDLRRPAAGTVVALDVVDSFGDPSEGAALSATTVTSDSDGFAGVGSAFVAQGIGTYRIRATYADKHARSATYSSTIVVTE